MNNEIVIEILVRIHIFKLWLAIIQNVSVQIVHMINALVMEVKNALAHQKALLVVATNSN